MALSGSTSGRRVPAFVCVLLAKPVTRHVGRGRAGEGGYSIDRIRCRGGASVCVLLISCSPKPVNRHVRRGEMIRPHQ